MLFCSPIAFKVTSLGEDVVAFWYEVVVFHPCDFGGWICGDEDCKLSLF